MFEGWKELQDGVDSLAISSTYFDLHTFSLKAEDMEFLIKWKRQDGDHI